MELLVQAFRQESDEVIPSGGDVVGGVPKDFSQVHLRLVTVNDSGVSRSVDDVRTLIFERFWSEASKRVEMASPYP